MATRAKVQGLIERHKGSTRDLVFDKECNSMKEILEATEQAFEEDADLVISRRIRPVKKFS